ncbi:nuclear-pore anchor [Senna tora]|uniref:Nuclear-pore anchor n=1 Tax=Senna tora TaxID=362788 RepID=A0A834WKA9_9FABA|nr:nuclear-pore anchor [Senna tora]
MPLFLSDEEFSQCSNDASVVANKADAFIRGLINELETVKAKADASDINAEQNCSLIEQKYLSLTAEFSKLESQVAELQSTLDQRLFELSEVQAQKQQIHLQSVEKDREIERLRTEVGELHKSKRQLIELNEQKDLELSEKNATIKSYLDKIVNMSENAAQKEARLSEVEAELLRSRAECTRLSQEKEIVERQNSWLNDELTAKVNSSFEMRRKHTELEADMSSKLEDVERQFSECSKSLQWNKDRVRELEMKLKSMHEELISAKDAAAAKEERLYTELSTVNKLNELYKESSEEWSRKAAELEGVIKAMEQTHLKQVEDDYKERLEKESSARKQVEKEASDLKAKLETCEAEIQRSKKNELNLVPLSSFNPEPPVPPNSGDRLHNCHGMVVGGFWGGHSLEMMEKVVLYVVHSVVLVSRWLVSNESNDMVEESHMLVPKIPVGVSGTALAASLLRDGWSLAKLYAKYQEAVDALRHEQLGRKESEAILQRVLYELEEKAEAIIDERVEHEKMVEAYSLMNQKLQNSFTEKANLEKTIQELKADLRRHERDYSLAQKEISDLQKQNCVVLSAICTSSNLSVLQRVTVLLKECRDIQLRCGSTGFDTVDVAANIASRIPTETDAEKVISEHLLTFKDINGLVEQNVQLRSLARSLSEQIENKEREFKEKLELELKKHTEEAASKVTAVLQRAEEQGRMIESLHSSVAMYKRLYEEEHNLHLAHSNPLEAPPVLVAADGGRNSLKALIESSQEATKKSLEKAMEHVRCLEDDLTKSRSENIVLRSERDKLVLEANFARERLDSFMKEFEHQKAESNGVLARNVEFSQLIVDYQRKLRESSESLNAAEELSRKLSMELSVLKNEKEVILNAEKRASDEVRSLSERVQRLQASLGTIQSAEEIREESRAAERRKQQEYIKILEKEWAEAKKELQEERESVRTLTLDRDQSIKNTMRQVEEMGKELTKALRAVASAESRAAVAESKLSSLQRKMSSTENKDAEMDRGSGSGTLSSDEVVAELRAAKEEIEKWKEEAQANKSHMLQYKSIAEVNEDALKQIEIAHENFKIEADNAKKALEAELGSLREKVSELENESSLKSEEVASAAAGKEAALTSAMAEITNLKEEILAKSLKISAMEVQISGLKEDLDKEHQRWRAAQTNYERQVILQSETIQELTKTSQALAVLQKEASELRKLTDAQKIENDKLNAKWEEEKAVLEKSKNDAEKKYNDINEQNKILHCKLEALHIQLAEKERDSAGILSHSSSADTISDANLQNVINYLRNSKETAEIEMSLLNQKNLQLESQLESAVKAANSAHASLEAERAKSKSLFTEDEFKSLQLQVREMNLLRESNMQLREENKHNFLECQKLREIAQKARSETENLDNLLSEKEKDLQGCKQEIETLKMEKDNLDHKVSELLERCKNVDLEDYERMKNLFRETQDKLKERDAQAEEIRKTLLEKQDSISHLEQDLSKCRSELEEREKRINDVLQVEATLKLDVEKHKKMLAQFKKRIEILSKEKEDLGKENQQLSKQLEEIKQGKRSTSDATGEQAMMEEKDTKLQFLEKLVEKQREEIKENRMERGRRLKTEKAIMESYNNVEQEKTKFISELERHKEVVKRLSDEIEKLRVVIGNLPEGTNVAQLLSGSNVDDLAAAYIAAVENFEREVQSVLPELGGRGNPGDATSNPDTSAAATGPVVPVQSSSVICSVTPGASSLPAPGAISLPAPGAVSLPPKATDEIKKRPALPKANIETRKHGRRLVRPRLGKPEEPQGDREMSEAEGPQIGAKAGPSGDTETQSNLTLLSQTMARKRVATTSTADLRDESVAAGENNSDVVALSAKKSKGSDSPQESEGHPAATLEHTGNQPITEESFDVGDLLQGQNEEVIEAQNEEGEVIAGKAESKDPLNFDSMIQEKSQGDRSSILEGNLDPTVETKVMSDDMQGEPGNQQSLMELGNEKEEGELVPEAADLEGGSDISNLVENQEICGHSEPAATPEPWQAMVEDETLEAGEINSPELSNDDKNDEGDMVEEAADGSDKSNDANDAIAVETDQVAEAAPVINESPSTSNAAETGSSKVIPVPKQSSSAPSETEEIKQASPISSTSTTINLSERARERAQMRQAGVVSSIGRGRGRAAPRGRVARGGRAGGRRQPPGDA